MSVQFKTADGQLTDTGMCERNLNLLAHAQSVELDIGSQCGGHGICGNDRLQLKPDQSGLISPVTEIEREHLSQKELSDGWRLGCQCFPEKSELELTLIVRR